ncbi:aminopeptidase N [Cryptosporangium arvum]|uniref:Aminopeptidase N n=1 Tax=Cryptosporangium arvum DSM 44712 TaxID=927661 RepID=A0A010ZNT4_9ACTN|nr:aminopeptidase N [Cryptosporangium arvum]EXG80339.1 aminopeptidase N [Cryptosporangium arvum DSM 44712]
MAGTNLTLGEARERGDLLEVASYHITLDLTDGTGKPGTDTFRSVTEVKFSARRPGASTFIDLIAKTVRAATLNGTALDVSGYDPEKGLELSGLEADNVLVVDADCLYMNTGEGLHRFVDPVDDEVYLYSQFETGDAKRVYACFDQPDLKATFTLEVTAPDHWEVVSNTTPEKAGAVRKFPPTARMSTYITALVAGPYHKVTDLHDDIPLGLYCRQSLKEFLDPDEIFEITKQGFDFFHEHFGVRYPFGKYDQLIVPEFNAGAMENAGCVTITESYIFRGKVTDYVRENRANTILHEMAHMWFGDLVTMRWWDDLWLNESFAEWAAHWAAAGGTRFTDSWAAFCTDRKGWGYRQDQLSSTHPIAADIPDMQAVEVNFDGITYAKGASVLKQLVAFVGEDEFVSGLRSYFKAHAFGNTTLADLLTALTEASGRDLSNWSAQWLETAGVNTLRPSFTLAPDGSYASFAVTQEGMAEHGTLRAHRIAIGLYDLSESTGKLIRRRRVETDIHGARTEIDDLVGETPPAVVLLNDDDLTYAKIRLDERSLSTVVDHIGGFTESLPRSLLWATAWDMCRDAELPTRDYVRLVLNGLAAESTISVVETQLRQARAALASYADPEWAPTGYALVADAALERLRAAEPGSDVQLVWARTFAGTARTDENIAVLKALLDGSEIVPGLEVDTELRWDFLQSLVARGAAGEAEITAELERDNTDQGSKEAATARALVPTAEAKAAAWHLATEDDTIPNQVGLSVIRGFGHPDQAALLEPYVERFFAAVSDVWARRTSEVAQNVAVLLYPAWAVSEDTVARTDAWLAGADHPPALRRLVVEGKDRLVRALRARACDASASS